MCTFNGIIGGRVRPLGRYFHPWTNILFSQFNLPSIFQVLLLCCTVVQHCSPKQPRPRNRNIATMKTPSCFVLAIVAVSFARPSEAGGGRRDASAWNANSSSHRRFGSGRRTGVGRRDRRPTFVVAASEQSSPAAEVMDILLQDETPSSSSSPSAESAAEGYHPRRIVADGARAAAVAFVSAAAIGGARHAIEMIGE